MLLEGGLKTNQKENLLMDNEMCEDYLFQQCTDSDDHCYTSSAAADPFTDLNPAQSLLISSSPHHSYHNKANNNNNNIFSDHTNYYLSYQNNTNNNQFIQTYHKTQDEQKHQEYCDLVEQQIEQSDELNDMLYSGEDQYDYLLNDDVNNLNHYNNKYHCSSGIPHGKSNYSKNQQNKMYIQEDHKNMYLNQRESNEHQGYPLDNLSINQYWNFQPSSFHETSLLKNEQPQQIDNSIQINFNQFNQEFNENVIQNQLIYQKQQTDSTPSMQNKKIRINLKHEPNFLSGSESIQKSIENHNTLHREENQIPNNNNNNYQNLKNNKNEYFGEQINQVRLDSEILPHSHQESNNIQLKIEYSLDQVLQSSTLPTSCNYYELLQQYEKQQAQSKNKNFLNKSNHNQEQHQIEHKINNNYNFEQQNDSATINLQQSSLSAISNTSQTHKIENDFYFASNENHENQCSSSANQVSQKTSFDNNNDDIKFEHENLDEVKEEVESKAGMTDEELLQYNLKQEFIAKSNKKNVVKNIMSAFKNFILDPVLHNYNLADLEVVLAMYNTTKKGIDDLSEMQSKFKRYITSKNFNHYTVKLLIQHQNYSNVFKYFLSGPIESWVKNSKVSDISSHVTMIEYLKECFDDIKLIDFLKRHEKKRAHFQ